MGGGNGRKWEENGRKTGRYTHFTVPVPLLSRRSKTLPTFPFVKINSLHSPTEKWAFFLLSRHSPPQRLRGRLALGCSGTVSMRPEAKMEEKCTGQRCDTVRPPVPSAAEALPNDGPCSLATPPRPPPPPRASRPETLTQPTIVLYLRLKSCIDIHVIVGSVWQCCVLSRSPGVHLSDASDQSPAEEGKGLRRDCGDPTKGKRTIGGCAGSRNAGYHFGIGRLRHT